jgi:hypothetical protein
VGRPLQRHLVLDGDAVGEDQHAAAGGDGVGGLGDGVGAGHGDDRQGGGVGPQLVQAGADGAVRNGVGGAGRALPLGQGGVDGGHRGGERIVVLGADADEQLLRQGVAARRQAHALRQLEVERSGHRDDHAGHAGERGDGAAHLHQPDGVGVDTGAQRDRAPPLRDG